MPTTQKPKVAPLKGTGGKPWSNAEITFLKRNYRKLTDKQLGETIGRSADSVAGKRKYLNLVKDPARSHNQYTDAVLGVKKTSEVRSPIEPSNYDLPSGTKKPWWKIW